MYYNDVFQILKKNIRIVYAKEKENLKQIMLNVSLSSGHK